MVRIHSTLNAFEAHVIRSGLRQHGIEAEVRNEMLSPLAGALPLTDVMPEVWVPEADAEAARDIIEALRQPGDDEGQLSIVDPLEGGQLSPAPGGELSSVNEERTCPNCKETSPPGFGECWNCQTSLVG